MFWDILAPYLIAICPPSYPWVVFVVQYFKPHAMVEHITLPARFLTSAAHLIAVLTIAFDVEMCVKRGLDSDASNNELDSAKLQLSILAYASLGLFFVEFVAMFSGVSLFLPTFNMLYVVLHFIGTIFTIIFIAQEMDPDIFIIIFSVFIAFPVFVELIVVIALTKMRLMEYS
eukprot:jgi/Mesvir1/7662/Mv11422-RA.1